METNPTPSPLARAAVGELDRRAYCRFKKEAAEIGHAEAFNATLSRVEAEARREERERVYGKLYGKVYVHIADKDGNRIDRPSTPLVEGFCNAWFQNSIKAEAEKDGVTLTPTPEAK